MWSVSNAARVGNFPDRRSTSASDRCWRWGNPFSRFIEGTRENGRRSRARKHSTAIQPLPGNITPRARAFTIHLDRPYEALVARIGVISPPGARVSIDARAERAAGERLAEPVAVAEGEKAATLESR